MKNRKKAFTLTEMLFVMAIIAIVISIIIPVAQTAVNKSRIHQAQTDIASIEMALEGYKAKYGVYPDASPANRVPVASLSEFMKFPSKRVISNEFYDPWNLPYRYSKPGANQKDFVDIASAGPDRNIDDGSWMTSAAGNNADNINNWSQAGKR